MNIRIAALVVGFGLAGAAFAGDVWKDKPYTQWQEEDVRKIMTESPWVKATNVSASWRSGGSETAHRIPTANDPKAGGGSGGYGMAGSGSGTAENSAGAARDIGLFVGDPTQAQFVVRWASSQTLRQALARSQVLRGTMTQAEAEKLLGEVPAEYTVTVAGLDMTPFLHLEEKDMMTRAYLMPKKEKTKIAPSKIVIQRKPGTDATSSDPKSVAAVVFYFAKKQASGEPVLGVQEKNAEFVYQEKSTTIRATFELQKMAGPQGLDW